MRAWARRLSPALSKLAQQIVRYPPRTMARRRRQVPMVELPVRFIAFFRHRLRNPMPRLCSIGHCLLVKIAHRMTPSPITVIEMTVRNGEFPLFLWSV